MPELPEVEHLRRTLEPHLLGRVVVRAVLRRRDICEAYSGALRRTRAGESALLEGARIARLQRHGKQLAILAEDGRALCVHLGMSGRMVWAEDRPRPRPKDHAHAIWELEHGWLVFSDPRRFGGLWAYPSLAALTSHRWSGLGPDGLVITGAELTASLGSSTRAVKSGLLDQSAAAGVGNIYADESLFEAGITPRRRCDRISPEEWERLAAAVRAILAKAISAGGTTRRDYVDGNGQPGRAQDAHAVYGRAGLACVNCGRTLRTGVVGQRTTVWCDSCQR